MSRFSLPPFSVLEDKDDRKGLSLPQGIIKLYGGDWVLPDLSSRPYAISNFVASRDGRVSYAIPGKSSGVEVAGNNLHDRWIMALLRARADAVVVGDNTMRTNPEHLWVSDNIFPEDKTTFQALRKAEQRKTVPIHCFVSLTGQIETRGVVFETDYPIVIATTEKGAVAAKALGLPSHVTIAAFGAEQVSIPQLFKFLHDEHRVRTILTEGGPGLYASCLKQHAIDDEFLTLSPRFIGEPAGQSRPSLLEGSGFLPEESPQCTIKSIRKVGDFLYLRSTIIYPENRALL